MPSENLSVAPHSAEILFESIDAEAAQRVIESHVQPWGLKGGEAIIVGGAALAARGIRDFHDIDVVVPKPIFDNIIRSDYQLSGMEKTVIVDYDEIVVRFVGAGYRSLDVVRPDGFIKYCPCRDWGSFYESSEELGSGLRYLSLATMREWKQRLMESGVATPQDMADLSLLEDHVARS